MDPQAHVRSTYRRWGHENRDVKEIHREPNQTHIRSEFRHHLIKYSFEVIFHDFPQTYPFRVQEYGSKEWKAKDLACILQRKGSSTHDETTRWGKLWTG